LLTLREKGFDILTRDQLRAELAQHAKGKGVAAWQSAAGKDDDKYIYALFKTRMDPDWMDQRWHGDRLMDLIEQFEAELHQKPVKNLGRTSPEPRFLSLRDVLKARVQSPVDA
jgi:hypothetical protein